MFKDEVAELAKLYLKETDYVRRFLRRQYACRLAMDILISYSKRAACYVAY